MEDYLQAFKNKKKKTYPKNDFKNLENIKNHISKILLSIIFFLVSIIYTNLSDKNLLLYKEHVLTESLPFTKIKGWYEDLFGEILPDPPTDQAVFNGRLVYKDIEDYQNGSKLKVNNHTLINNLTGGIVVYVGEKEDFGNTVIIQGADGTDIWYGNLTNISVKLYDYIAANTLLGEVDGEDLYIVIKKEDKYLKYEEYQNT